MSSTHDVLSELEAGSNWESYVGQLEQYFARNHVPESEKVEVLLATVSPALYSKLRDLCHPDLPQFKTYSQLANLLEPHCLWQFSVIEERVKFHKAKQACEENTTDWFTRIMNLSINCGFGKLNETILRDKFVSGLADQRIARRISEEDGTATLMSVVDLAVKTEEKFNTQDRGEPLALEKDDNRRAQLSVRKTHIFDMPDEILISVILYLNPRERFPVAESCKKFKRIIFEDEQALRYLDFSKDGYLTSVSDIQQYFGNEVTRKNILGVNIRNVNCVKSVGMLNDTIGRAINLVHVNIHGRPFEDVWQLASFLAPLKHLERLCFDWRIEEENAILCRKLLQTSFARLTYLEVNMPADCFKKFLFSLELCEALTKLYVEVTGHFGEYYHPVAIQQFEKLRNLKIIEYCGSWTHEIRRSLESMLPDPEKWTEFQMEFGDCCMEPQVDVDFYLEKDVEVCEEMKGSEWMNIAPRGGWGDKVVRLALYPEVLLQRTLEITHENVPERLSCLSYFMGDHRCLLTIEDCKRLLKNPRYQVPYLFTSSDTTRDSDLHLITSAFPNLTELFLADITKSSVSVRNEPHSMRRLRRRGCAVNVEEDDLENLDSCFKMIVQNTPNLIHFTMEGSVLRGMETGSGWDYDAPHLISVWKNLRALRLMWIPVRDGEFLLEIGKECPFLEQFTCLTVDDTDSFKEGLLQMLRHCKKLKQFSVKANNLGQVSDMTALLAKNKHLNKVRVSTFDGNCTTASLTSSIEQLLRGCSELTTFICGINETSGTDCEELLTAVQRIKNESISPNLQIQLRVKRGKNEIKKVGTLHEDVPLLRAFHRVRTAATPNFNCWE